MNVREISWANHTGIVVVFEKGDEFLGSLRRVAGEHGVTGASFTGVGAFERATLGFFDRNTMDYHQIPVEEQTEVLTLTGNIAISEGKPKIHAHVVLGRKDGQALGGHILEAHVWPTLEVLITQTPTILQRHTDPETGLALLRL